MNHENETHASDQPVTAPRTRRRRLTWGVPAVVVVAVAAAVTVPIVATASPSLPARSAAELLVDVSNADGTPLSGTVVETARLGLPELPSVGGSSISPLDLLSGSHTAKVWYDGKDKARIALVDDLAETDLVRNGRDVWLWTSGKNTAQHAKLPAAGHDMAPQPDPAESLTPQAAAKQALAAIDPSTKVRVDGTASVAGRSAYELVLTPRDESSLIGDVRIAIDSETNVPLRVQVNAAGATGRPAFETAFTSVTFEKPSASVFRFSPPPGAKVSELKLDGSSPDAAKDGAAAHAGAAPRIVGKGWTSVLELTTKPAPEGADEKSHPGAAGNQVLRALEGATTTVSGPYGTGKLLRTRLISVLLLDDGRVLVGAVKPAVLEQAAGS